MGGWTSAAQSARDNVRVRPCQEKPSKHTVENDELTLVVRNIPESYTQEGLLLEWPSKSNSYNLLYMPRSSSNDRGASHAFINFTAAAAALAFKNKWHGKLLKETTEKGTKLNVSIAKVQGSSAILALLKRRRVGRMQSQNQPKLFKDGIPVCLNTMLAEADKEETEENRLVPDTCLSCPDNGAHNTHADRAQHTPEKVKIKVGTPEYAMPPISPAHFAGGMVHSL